jgi:hypothetical protein
MIRKIEDYRKFADLCRNTAEQAKDEATRKSFAQLASFWLELTHEAMNDLSASDPS